MACNRLAAPAPPRPCDVAVKEDDEDFKQGATEAEAVAVEEEEEVERRVAVEEDEEDCERGPTEAVAVEEEGGVEMGVPMAWVSPSRSIRKRRKVRMGKRTPPLGERERNFLRMGGRTPPLGSSLILRSSGSQ